MENHFQAEDVLSTLITCKYCNSTPNDTNVWDLRWTRTENIHRSVPAGCYGTTNQSGTEDKPVNVTLLECLVCQRDIAIYHKDAWCAVEDFVQRADDSTSIQQVRSTFDHKVLYLLSQVFYNQSDLSQSEPGTDTDSPFLRFSVNEDAWLVWVEGHAVGFYSVKEKGSPVSCSGWLTYDLPVLDTIYVRSEYRRRGLATDMLEHFMAHHPQGDLGISSPVSGGLLTVLYKLLCSDASLRSRLWECEGSGTEGERRNLWFHARCTLNKRKRTSSRNWPEKRPKTDGLKPGIEATSAISGTAAGSEVIQTGSEVSLMGSEVKQKGSEVNLMGSEVGQTDGSKVNLIRSEVKQKGSKVNMMVSEIKQMGSKINLIGSEINQMGSRVNQMGSEVKQTGSEIKEIKELLSTKSKQ